VGGRPLVDLNYHEDSSAEVDANLVFTGAGELVEVQATGENGTLSRGDLNAMLDAGEDVARQLSIAQAQALGGASERLGLHAIMMGTT
jgi:ribonuclease PH